MREYLSTLVDDISWARHYPTNSFSSKLKVLRDFRNLHELKGLTRYEYQQFRFERCPEVFRQTFLGKEEQRYYLDYLNPVKYSGLARNKYLAHRILEHTGVRKAELFCYYHPEGQVLGSDLIAHDLAGVVRILKQKNVSACVVKETEGFHGNNVFVIRSILWKGNDGEVTYFNGEKKNLSEILSDIPVIFESEIKQTAQLSAFNESSVNTVRFMTMLYPDGKARLLDTFIKIGRTGKCVDNAGGGGNVDACIDKETGVFKYVIQFDGYENVKDIEKHPDSGAQIAGVKINNWEEIVKEVLHFQECFPFIKAAGWDIALTDDGPVVIEINDFWDRTGQLFIRRGWREEIRDCFLAWQKTGAQYIPYRAKNALNKKLLEEIANR